MKIFNFESFCWKKSDQFEHYHNYTPAPFFMSISLPSILLPLFSIFHPGFPLDIFSLSFFLLNQIYISVLTEFCKATSVQKVGKAHFPHPWRIRLQKAGWEITGLQQPFCSYQPSSALRGTWIQLLREWWREWTIIDKVSLGPLLTSSTTVSQSEPKFCVDDAWCWLFSPWLGKNKPCFRALFWEQGPQAWSCMISSRTQSRAWITLHLFLPEWAGLELNRAQLFCPRKGHSGLEGGCNTRKDSSGAVVRQGLQDPLEYSIWPLHLVCWETHLLCCFWWACPQCGWLPCEEGGFQSRVICVCYEIAQSQK